MKKSKQNLSILNVTLGSGGAEKVISLLLKELVNDYNVTLVLLYNQIHFTIPKEVNTIVLCKKKTDRPTYLKIIDSFNFLIKYNRLIRSNNISIAVSFLALPNLLNGITSILNKNVKTIISERGFPSDNTTSKLSLNISKMFYPIFYNKCSRLFSNSVYINEDLKDNFGINIPMDVIYNPIELPFVTIQPKNLGKHVTSLKIITAGTLNKRKNQILIIRAIKNTSKNYELTILGGGELHDYLVNESKKLNIPDQVLLKGKVKNVNDYLLNNHCFVLSSFTEGFPNALLEAMAIGLPCISTNCLSGPLELLNENKKIEIQNGTFYKGIYGLIINNNDHEGLKLALEFYKSNPNEREKYSRLSLQRAKEYELKSIYSKFYNFINN